MTKEDAPALASAAPEAPGGTVDALKRILDISRQDTLAKGSLLGEIESIAMAALRSARAGPAGEPVYCVGWHSIDQMLANGMAQAYGMTLIPASDLMQNPPVRSHPPAGDAREALKLGLKEAVKMADEKALAYSKANFPVGATYLRDFADTLRAALTAGSGK